MEEKIKQSKVVGLKYEPGGRVPEVILKGCGPLADEILRQRNWDGGPPVIKNPELLNKLYRLPVDSAIGPELFNVVAIVLTHIFAINGKAKQGAGK